MNIQHTCVNGRHSGPVVHAVPSQHQLSLPVPAGVPFRCSDFLPQSKGLLVKLIVDLKVAVGLNGCFDRFRAHCDPDLDKWKKTEGFM